MDGTVISTWQIRDFGRYLREAERAEATIAKYGAEVRALAAFLCGKAVTKELLLEYRNKLLGEYCTRTVNGKLSAVNAFLEFAGMQNLKLKTLRVQRRIFIEEDRELTEVEYRRLLKSAVEEKNERLYYLIMTLAGTGIRISEVRFITVEAVRRGRAEIRLKGKTRVILFPDRLKGIILRYARRRGILRGCIFRTRSGMPVDRSNVCHEMKRLCAAADVAPGKVFPHNFRHLFARSFYKVDKNLAHLADILGHSSIETTRIYVASSVRMYEDTLCRMKLII